MKQITLRRVVLVVAVAVLVALAVLTAVRFERSREMARAADRFREAVGPLEFQTYAPEPVPDTDNAAVPIREALDRLEARGEEDSSWSEEIARLRRRNRSAAGTWSEEDLRRARAAVASRAEVMAALHEAVGRSGSSFGLEYSDGPAMEIPNLLMALHSGDLLFARARLAWLEGEPAEAIRSVEALAALSRALQGETALIFQLIGHAVEDLQYRSIREGLASARLDLDALRRLRRSVDDEPRDDRLRDALGTEGAMVYYARPGGPAFGGLTGLFAGVGGVADMVVDGERWLDRVGYRLLGHDSVARGLDYYARAFQAFSEFSYQEILEQPDLIEPPSGDGTRLVVDLENIVGTVNATAELARLARLALDVAVAGAESGSLPEDLPAGAETGPGPFTGEAPIYRPAPDGSATLTIPGAGALWDETKPPSAVNLEGDQLFEWRVRGPWAAEVAPETSNRPVSE